MTQFDPQNSTPVEDQGRGSHGPAPADTEPARARVNAARVRAEEAHQPFLAAASVLLASSLDYEKTLQNLAIMLVPRLGDFCVMDLIDDGQSVRRVAIADVEPAREERVRRIAHEHPRSFQAPTTCSKVIATGESEWLPEVTDSRRLTLPKDVGRGGLGNLDFHSFICVALPVHGQILGTISIARSTPRVSFTAVDLALLEELARRASLAVDHARLYKASENANRAKDEFLATLSNQLRAPLSSVRLCVQMLRRGHLDAETTARALETIEQKVDLEVLLVDHLVESSRVSAKRT